MLIIEAVNTTKIFSENQAIANSDICFSLEEGETHSILGENGSGKSTLMHIISGLIPPDSGKILYRGEEVFFRSPGEALERGIGMIHQSPGIIPGYNVIENIIAGNKSIKGLRIDRKECINKLESIKNKYSIHVDIEATPDTPELKQYTVLLSLLYRDTDIIIFDEPTTSFSDTKTEEFFMTLDKLKQNGKTIVFITHKIATALNISDRITVLSKGRNRGTFNKNEITSEKIFSLMIEDYSRDSFETASRVERADTDEKILVGENIGLYRKNERKKLKISFDLYKGEIIGFTGIRENNLNILEDILGGFISPDSGSLKFRGKDISGYTTAERRETGITYIPSDRFTRGTSITSSVENNMAIATIRKFTRRGIVSNSRLKKHFNRGADLYNIKADYGQPLWQLSGGNIQKVILYRELDTNPEILIFCEPAWNLDIKSKKMVYETIRDLRDKGTSIIVLSTDIEEVVDISDKVYVLYQGKITAVLEGDDINSKTIGEMMLGLKKQKTKKRNRVEK